MHIKIAMVDDHVLIRDALATVISSFEDCEVILSACHGEELIEKLQADHLPDLIILDLDMPVLNGYQTAEWLRDHYPKIYVLVLTVTDSDLATIRLLRLGVRGVLIKDIHPRELKKAIYSIMETGYYHFGSTTNKLINLLKEGDPKDSLTKNIRLTENEMKFLELASTEMTYKAIALQMGVNTRSIDNYRDSLFNKLSVTSRVGLVLFAMKNGIKGFNY